jgi:hypothetical protein
MCIIDILQIDKSMKNNEIEGKMEQYSPFNKSSKTEERSPMRARRHSRADTPDQIEELAKPLQPKANYEPRPDTSTRQKLQQNLAEALEEITELKAIIAKRTQDTVPQTQRRKKSWLKAKQLHNYKTTILKNNQVKVNCGKNHPASYRGCEAAKELQREEMKPAKNNNLEHSQLTKKTSPKNNKQHNPT